MSDAGAFSKTYTGVPRSSVCYDASVFYTAVFHTGKLPVSYTPDRYDSMQMSTTDVLLIHPCRCLLYRFASMQLCTTQECLIPGCLRDPCVSTPVRFYRCPCNTGGRLLLHLRACALFYSSSLQDWVPVTGAPDARPRLPPGSTLSSRLRCTSRKCAPLPGE